MLRRISTLVAVVGALAPSVTAAAGLDACTKAIATATETYVATKQKTIAACEDSKAKGKLAAEVNWLTEHVRWDMEEDLARVMGDVPAHTLSQMAQFMSTSLREFLAKAAAFAPGKSAK